MQSSHPSCPSYLFSKKEKGVVTIIMALSMVVLIGFIGIALDLGKLYIAKSELQNSADSCALAAVRELAGANKNQLMLAEAAGITVGMQHAVLFQSERISFSVDDSVTFSQTINGQYRPKNGISSTENYLMQYVSCTVERSEIVNWFIQVLNLLPGITIGNQTVAAVAVAGRSPSQTTSCAVPIAICSSAITPVPPAGTWLQSLIGTAGSGSGPGNLTGSFMWVDYSPSGGGSSDLGGNLTGAGICNVPVTSAQVSEAAATSSLAASWNSRFGVYQGSIRQDESIPDYTGYAYTDAAESWPTKFNAFNDFRDRRGIYASYQGDATTGLNINGTIADAGELQASGGDRRLATVAIIDCAGFTSGSKTAAIQSWACILMLHPLNNSTSGGGTGANRMYLEFLGRSNDRGSPCTTSGLSGGPASGGPLAPALVR